MSLEKNILLRLIIRKVYLYCILVWSRYTRYPKSPTPHPLSLWMNDNFWTCLSKYFVGTEVLFGFILEVRPLPKIKGGEIFIFTLPYYDTSYLKGYKKQIHIYTIKKYLQYPYSKSGPKTCFILFSKIYNSQKFSKLILYHSKLWLPKTESIICFPKFG